MRPFFFKYALGVLVLPVLISCGSKNQDIVSLNTSHIKTDKTMEILNSLDSAGSNIYQFFPNFSNENYNYIGSKMTLYKADSLWAIVFEEVIFNINEARVEIILNYFGNCLSNMDIISSQGRKHISNMKRVYLTEENDVLKLCDNFPFVSTTCKFIKIGGRQLEINHNYGDYLKSNNIPYKSQKRLNDIDITSVLRFLYEKDPSVFHATETGKTSFFNDNIPKLMELYKWHHKEYFCLTEHEYIGTPPSQYETFQMLAKVIESGDTTKYNPTLEPNTDWRNWTD